MKARFIILCEQDFPVKNDVPVTAYTILYPARTPQEVVDYLESIPKDFEVVILDIREPKVITKEEIIKLTV